MSYGDTGVGDTGVAPRFAWTNPEMRRSHRWNITPYLANTAITDDIYYAYTEDEMQTKFGKMQQLAKTTMCYDQIIVTLNKVTVPSAVDTGVNGDRVP
jgi:hypothetical protein